MTRTAVWLLTVTLLAGCAGSLNRAEREGIVRADRNCDGAGPGAMRDPSSQCFVARPASGK